MLEIIRPISSRVLAASCSGGADDLDLDALCRRTRTPRSALRPAASGTLRARRPAPDAVWIVVGRVLTLEAVPARSRVVVILVIWSSSARGVPSQSPRLHEEGDPVVGHHDLRQRPLPAVGDVGRPQTREADPTLAGANVTSSVTGCARPHGSCRPTPYARRSTATRPPTTARRPPPPPRTESSACRAPSIGARPEPASRPCLPHRALFSLWVAPPRRSAPHHVGVVNAKKQAGTDALRLPGKIRCAAQARNGARLPDPGFRDGIAGRWRSDESGRG